TPTWAANSVDGSRAPSESIRWGAVRWQAPVGRPLLHARPAIAPADRPVAACAAPPRRAADGPLAGQPGGSARCDPWRFRVRCRAEDRSTPAQPAPFVRLASQKAGG